jgi:hypothetical protein
LIEVLDQMVGEELVLLPMDMEVCDIRALMGIACLFVVRILGMKIQETAEKMVLFFAPAKSTSLSSVSGLIHR